MRSRENGRNEPDYTSTGMSGHVLLLHFMCRLAALTGGGLMGGVRISLLGFECDLIFDTSGTREGIWPELCIVRTSLFLTTTSGRKKYVLLSWQKGMQVRTINFRLKSPE